MKISKLAALALLSFTSILQLHAEPLFENSVVSNDLDFITKEDPVTPFKIEFVGRGKREMPDKRSDELFVNDVYLFKTVFEDESNLKFWVDPDVADKKVAEVFVKRVSEALGKQPLGLRKPLSHVVIHEGDETAFAEEQAGFFVLYTKNIEKRISTHDLEETVFHETVHATLEAKHAKNPKWLAAQKADAKFITNYAAANPKKEDLPESALFAYALLKTPGRLPAEIESKIREIMPQRLAYFEQLFSSWEIVNSKQ